MTELLEQKLVAKTPIFDLVNRTYSSKEQGTFERSVVQMYNNAVAVLLYDIPTGLIYIEKEFRAGINRETYSIPAGKINDGEAPISALSREVKEETGYDITTDEFDFEFVTAVNSSEGFTDELVYIYIVRGNFTDKIPEEKNLDKDEYMVGAFSKYPEEMLEANVTFSAPTFIALSKFVDSQKINMLESDQERTELVDREDEDEEGDFYVG